MPTKRQEREMLSRPRRIQWTHRGYAFDEPKQLVAIWVQIAAFARGLKSKGEHSSAVWEDARKLRDLNVHLHFEAVWRRAIYPSIMCSGDDECAVESEETRNKLKGEGECVGRVYVRALDRAAILLGVNETANQAPGLAVANAAILQAILSRLDNALVRTILSLDDMDDAGFIEDIANLVPGKGVMLLRWSAENNASFVSRWSESVTHVNFQHINSIRRAFKQSKLSRRNDGP